MCHLQVWLSMWSFREGAWALAVPAVPSSEVEFFQACLFVHWTGRKTAALCPFKNIFIYLEECSSTGFHAYIRENSKRKGCVHSSMNGVLFLAWALTHRRTGNKMLVNVDSGCPGRDPRGWQFREKLTTAASILQTFLFRYKILQCVCIRPRWKRGWRSLLRGLERKSKWNLQTDLIRGSRWNSSLHPKWLSFRESPGCLGWLHQTSSSNLSALCFDIQFPLWGWTWFALESERPGCIS